MSPPRESIVRVAAREHPDLFLAAGTAVGTLMSVPIALLVLSISKMFAAVAGTSVSPDAAMGILCSTAIFVMLPGGGFAFIVADGYVRRAKR